MSIKKDCSTCIHRSAEIKPGLAIYLRCNQNNGAIIWYPICCRYYEPETTPKKKAL